MQALQLKSASGWRWVAAGWQLFRTQPFSFAALLFFYWLLLLCASAVIGWLAHGVGAVLPFIPVDFVAALGSLLVAMLTPALTVGFLQACRTASTGQQVHPLLLFAPFRSDRKTLRRLLVLGSFQVIALVFILLLTSGSGAFRSAAPVERPSVAGPATNAAGKSTAPSRPAGGKEAEAASEAEQEAIRREAIERMAQGLAYLPVALLMWYAPVLVAWHGLPPGKALFFSLVAVWRNRAPFVVYGAAWLALWLSLSIAIALATTLLGIGNFAAIVAAPLVMLLLTCMYCSVYPTYSTVFVDPVDDPGGQARVDEGS